MRSYLSGRAGCLYRQTAGSWNVLDTLSNVIICNHLSASRRFCYVREPSMGFQNLPWDSRTFYGILWGFMRFYDVSVNQSVPTVANRGLTSYSFNLLLKQSCTLSQLLALNHNIEIASAATSASRFTPRRLSGVTMRRLYASLKAQSTASKQSFITSISIRCGFARR
jgi:hypothetical protein